MFYMLFQAHPFNHPTFLSVISPSHWGAWNGFLPLGELLGQTTQPYTHMQNTHSSQRRKQNDARSVPTAVWVTDWLSLQQTQQLALCVSVQWHKRTTRVCVRDMVPAFPLALSIPFTRKSRVTVTPEQRNHTKTHRCSYTQTERGGGASESMGKFLTT